MLLFFFFQAEDGIRDRDVTGVQTCALPICPSSSSDDGCSSRRNGARRRGAAPSCGSASAPPRRRSAIRARQRSEERRVGKECRTRGAAEKSKQRVSE